MASSLSERYSDDMDGLVQWTIVAVSIHVTESRLGLGGSSARTGCVEPEFKSKSVYC